MRSLCPVIDFASDATEKSAPSASGNCPSGVAVVLSTATSTPASCARLHSAAMSHTSIVGFEGDSSQSSRAPSSCSPCASPTVGAMRSVTPILTKYSCITMRVAKYAFEGSTTTSPGRSIAPNTAVHAAIPEANTSALAR